MTFLEKFLEDHPDYDAGRAIHYYCPHIMINNEMPICCDGYPNLICEVCWNREMPEKVKEENKNDSK